MKKTIVTTLFFFLLAVVAGQESNEQFRTGRFAYGPWYVVQGDTLKFPATLAGKPIVVRTAKKQFEYIGNKVSEFDIVWESDSVYIMKTVTSGTFRKDETIRVTILETSGNAYRYRSETTAGIIESVLIKTGE